MGWMGCADRITFWFPNLGESPFATGCTIPGSSNDAMQQVGRTSSIKPAKFGRRMAFRWKIQVYSYFFFVGFWEPLSQATGALTWTCALPKSPQAIITWFYQAKHMFFPNSHAMGSCKTNRRTGAVGSPSELVGGWCPGHVLMASGSCDAGVPVML